MTDQYSPPSSDLPATLATAIADTVTTLSPKDAAAQGITEAVTTEESTTFSAQEIATTSEEVKQADLQESDNNSAFDQLLQYYRDLASTPRGLGNSFERLIQQALMQVPPYNLRFTQVQTYKEWQSAHPELLLSEVDTGIDLVATLREPLSDAPFVAIQCKFYREHSSLGMKDIATFVSVSNTPFFAERLLFVTNTGLNTHAKKLLVNQEKPIQVVSLEGLRQLPIDWAQYLEHKQVTSLPKRKLRPYQETAVSNTVNGFKAYDRGKLIMACGTGKTFTALRIAEKQAQQNHLVLCSRKA